MGKGLMFLIGGGVGLMTGGLLSLTFIGAICGIPMILVALPSLMYGGWLLREEQMEGLKRSIRSGIVEGAYVASSREMSVSCPVCRALNGMGTKFCNNCGAFLAVAPPAQITPPPPLPTVTNDPVEPPSTTEPKAGV